jgi:hypothetical protein
MKIKISIWNGIASRCIGLAEFDNVEDLLAYMEEVRKLDDKATYILREVIQK